MSTYWGLRCAECGLSSDLGAKEWALPDLRKLVGVAEPLRGLYSRLPAHSALLTITPGYWWANDDADAPLVPFVALHAGHRMEFINEYGGTRPLESVEVEGEQS